MNVRQTFLAYSSIGSTFRVNGVAGDSSQQQNGVLSAAQPGDRTTNPDIVMPERYESSQRVDSLTRVVITLFCQTHTRLHTPLSNICLSPSSVQHYRGLNSSFSCIPHAFFTVGLTVLATNPEYPTRALQARRTDVGRHLTSVETALRI